MNEQIVDIEQRKLKADDEIKRKLQLIKWICVVIVPIITVYPIIPVIVLLIVEKKFDHLYVFDKIMKHYKSKYKTKIYEKYFVDENKLRALKGRIMVIEMARD